MKTALALAVAFTLTMAGAVQGAKFYVTSHGWHTGIAVPRAAVLASGTWLPNVPRRDFAGSAWLELGWGDRKFYMAKNPGVAMAVSAALAPGRSVLHVAGLAGSPDREKGRWTALVPVPCTAAELRAICQALGGSFERDPSGRANRLGPGLYGTPNGFYAAHGRYWLGNTCNSWTLRIARAGGLPLRVGPRGTLQASAVVAQVRRAVRLKASDASPGRAKSASPSCHQSVRARSAPDAFKHPVPL